MAEKLDMKSMDITQDNIAKIKALFPSAVTEVMGDDGKVKFAIDFDALKQELSDDLISERAERYQMTWPDKSKAKVLANSRITATLRPDKEKSVDFDNTQNLYIEGDNLDVLKLLRETYLGKVKMIYIDPPYNTGNDFVYEDDFAMSTEDYAEVSGQYDDQGNRLVKNLDSNGRFHTDWLNMMYTRLKIAKDLLSNDGAIFISLDDNEIHNLIKLCDEIFGSTNKVGLMTIMSNPRGSQNSKYLSSIHEYILMYARNISDLVLSGIAKSDDSLSEFNETDENGRRYRALGLRKRGGAWKKEDRPNMFYPIYVNPDNGECFLDKKQNHFIEVIPKRPTGELSRWTWGKEKFSAERHLLVGKMVNRGSENANDNWDVFRKDYIDTESGEEKTTKLKTMWIEKEINYQNAKNEIKALFGNSEVFDYPKPTYIVQQLATIMNLEDEDIVMDFFSGSASSAQAIMQFNHNQSTKVRFIMVQISESIPEKSEAYKMGYRLITEIGEERIRRAGKKIKEESGLLSSTIDIGFRVLKLDSSNMQEVYYNPSAMTQDILAMTVDNVKADRTPLDLLFQVMLDLGIELSAKIEENSVNGKTYYAVNGNDIIACFDDDIDNDVITAIAKQNPLYAVFKDKSFATDSVGINNEQLFKTYSPSTVVKVI